MALEVFMVEIKPDKSSIEPCDDAQITVYGTVWCGDTRRALRWLDQNHIPYQWIDIDKDREAVKFVEKTNRGCRSVPTIVFPDGSILVEPSTMELEKKFGI
jgi:mycoredoxin